MSRIEAISVFSEALIEVVSNNAELGILGFGKFKEFINGFSLQCVSEAEIIVFQFSGNSVVECMIVECCMSITEISVRFFHTLCRCTFQRFYDGHIATS